LDRFIEQIAAAFFWEWCAVILALIYLVLAIKKSIWCWPAAFLSTAIYAWLFFDVNLFMESFLNAYYLIMALYGWKLWSRTKTDQKSKSTNSFRIIRWSLKIHLMIILILFMGVLLTGFLLSTYTSQDLAYLDSFTTIFALVATFMVTKKVLENWLYWIIINLVSVYLFYSKGLVLTSVLFSMYVILSVIGWYKWKTEFDSNHSIKSNLIT